MATLAELNDAARQGKASGSTRVVMTQGVNALPTEAIASLMGEVQRFNTFTEDNDPNGEHDFGKIVFMGDDYFWKIDYYDKDLEFGSEDPLDVKKTTRVLTVMLTSEY